MRHMITAALSVMALSTPLAAQTTGIEDLQFEMTEAQARTVLDQVCGETHTHHLSPSRFPIASEAETHIRCDQFELANGEAVESAMLTFADDRLVMIEVRGNAAAARPSSAPSISIQGYDVWVGDAFTYKAETDQAWLMHADAFQAFLLFWDNPAWTEDTLTAPADAFHFPEEIQFGRDFDAVMASLDGDCTVTMVQEIEEIWLGTEPAEQRQIDCMGYEISGYPRRLEFVFGDGQLEQMWVMFGRADIPRLREELTARYGEPVFVDETYEAYDGWRIALHKDIPEILMTSERLSAVWRERQP